MSDANVHPVDEKLPLPRLGALGVSRVSISLRAGPVPTQGFVRVCQQIIHFTIQRRAPPYALFAVCICRTFAVSLNNI